MGKCTCCGALNKTRTGCSCTGGKSHQCLRIAQPSEASTTAPPTMETMPMTSMASMASMTMPMETMTSLASAHVKGNQAKDSEYNFYWCKLPHITGEDHFQLQGFDSEWWYCCSCCKPNIRNTCNNTLSLR